ncbi:MAG: response regulator [Nitrospirae bacterium]|nr:response regulator [Nitrospirota bacterium]
MGLEDSKKVKVLLIDDEEDFGIIVKLNLEKTGKYDVFLATDGVTGIKTAKKVKPDVILLDLMMPVTDGTETYKQLGEGITTKNVPVIFLTALATKEDVEDGKGTIGTKHFIAKPVLTEDLIRRIDAVLRRNRID